MFPRPSPEVSDRFALSLQIKQSIWLLAVDNGEIPNYSGRDQYTSNH